jgi:uncharacterized protein YprB with RNaseH-like and TPR domain
MADSIRERMPVESLEARWRRLRGRPSPTEGRSALPDTGIRLWEETLSLFTWHGDLPLEAWRTAPRGAVATLAGHPDWLDIPAEGVLFLDTETTGLVGGAGTMIFLLGFARIEGEALVFRQLFLADPAAEPAFWQAFLGLTAGVQGLVTFNGRGFDLPLIEMRLNRYGLRWGGLDAPHWDLLPTARRLWRRRLPSRALMALEEAVLGLERSPDDVPGAEIPSRYWAYLQRRDPDLLEGVFLHNRQDVLSMVTLAARLAHLFENPERDPAVQGWDWVQLGRWYQESGRWEAAERAFRRALEEEAGDPELRRTAWHALGNLLRRMGRLEEAARVWQAWALEFPGEVLPAVRLARYYERTRRDPREAQRWARIALARIDAQGDPDRWASLRQSLTRRLAQWPGSLWGVDPGRRPRLVE